MLEIWGRRLGDHRLLGVSRTHWMQDRDEALHIAGRDIAGFLGALPPLEMQTSVDSAAGAGLGADGRILADREAGLQGDTMAVALVIAKPLSCVIEALHMLAALVAREAIVGGPFTEGSVEFGRVGFRP